eukprot:gene5784-biopygen1094
MRCVCYAGVDVDLAAHVPPLAPHRPAHVLRGPAPPHAPRAEKELRRRLRRRRRRRRLRRRRVEGGGDEV